MFFALGHEFAKKIKLLYVTDKMRKYNNSKIFGFLIFYIKILQLSFSRHNNLYNPDLHFGYMVHIDVAYICPS